MWWMVIDCATVYSLQDLSPRPVGTPPVAAPPPATGLTHYTSPAGSRFIIMVPSPYRATRAPDPLGPSRGKSPPRTPRRCLHPQTLCGINTGSQLSTPPTPPGPQNYRFYLNICTARPSPGLRLTESGPPRGPLPRLEYGHRRHATPPCWYLRGAGRPARELGQDPPTGTHR